MNTNTSICNDDKSSFGRPQKENCCNEVYVSKKRSSRNQSGWMEDYCLCNILST